MSLKIDYYFDFPSPYAYLAHTQLPRVAAERNDVLVLEQTSLVFLPLPPPQAILQPTLAVPHLLLYSALHLKLLAHLGPMTLG